MIFGEAGIAGSVHSASTARTNPRAAEAAESSAGRVVRETNSRGWEGNDPTGDSMTFPVTINSTYVTYFTINHLYDPIAESGLP